MAKEILVTKHFNQYNPGEIATFNDVIGQDIIDRRLGTEVKRDRKGNIIQQDVPDAADKPQGDPVVEPTPEPVAETPVVAPAPAQ